MWNSTQLRRSATSTLLAAALIAGGCNLLQNHEADASSGEVDDAATQTDRGPKGADGSETDTATAATDTGVDATGDTTATDATDPPENLLENPSFEKGPVEESCPPSWRCPSYGSGSGTFAVVGDAHHLEQSAKWSRTGDPTVGAVIKQAVPASEGTRYDVDVWVKASGLSDEAEVHLQILFDTPQNDARLTDVFVPDGSMADWAHISGTTSEAPANTEQLRFNLSIADTTGDVWWDAASLTRASGSSGDRDTGTDTGMTHDTSDAGTRVTVGGGQAYVASRRASGDTTYCSPSGTVVSSKSELFNAFNSASAGDVIYIQSGAQIDLSGTEDTNIPSGITLASDRGCNGADGGLLETSTYGWNLLDVESDVTIFGVRIEGPRSDWGKLSDIGAGLKIMGQGVEIANSEIAGFSHYAIQTGYDTQIHHNNIHHNTQKGLGYGVAVQSGHPVIEYNKMNYNRHSVASSGGGGYTARYNIVGPDAISHIFDQHKPGGTTTRIHHNTVRAVEQSDDPKNAPAVTIRGVPSDKATIHHNWIYNPKSPCHSDGNWPDCAILQMHVTSWQNVTFSDNHLGSSTPPSCNIGAPRAGCPAP